MGGSLAWDIQRPAALLYTLQPLYLLLYLYVTAAGTATYLDFSGRLLLCFCVSLVPFSPVTISFTYDLLFSSACFSSAVNFWILFRGRLYCHFLRYKQPINTLVDVPQPTLFLDTVAWTLLQAHKIQ